MNGESVLKKVLLAFLCLFVVGCLQSRGAFARDKECPPFTAEDLPIVESAYKFLSSRKGPIGLWRRLDTPDYYWLKGEWFELPFGYKNPWLSPGIKDPTPPPPTRETTIEGLKKSSVYTGYDPETGEYNPDLIKKGSITRQFAFWMPSKRYVERDLMFLPFSRPCEAGRPRPQKEDYVVRFWIEWPFLPGSADSPPARRFRNALERRAEGKLALWQDSEHEEHTLNGPISGTKDYHFYSDDGDLFVKLRCSGTSSKRPNPLCDGHVWKRSSDLIFYIRFTADAGQSGEEELWRAPVNATIDLISQWHKPELDEPQSGGSDE